MQFISTRGHAAPASFTDVVMQGLAPDGGLYVPQTWPKPVALSPAVSYTEMALRVIAPFTEGSLSPASLEKIITDTYTPDIFHSAAITPLRQISDRLHILELFHGPTLAFKDVALQFLGRLFDALLEQSGQKITIVGATSGDTGSAAIEACKGRKNISITILHPYGRTSEIQRRQMTSVLEGNVHNIAIEGTFDDCQNLVKQAFGDMKLRHEKNLSAINSINWARIIAQSVYYAMSAQTLGKAPAFAVPTGNFGNVYAAWVAAQIGVPIEHLVIGSNRNDILTRFFETGAMTLDQVIPSHSPSMDIQISSNFERYLFELFGRDSAKLSSKMSAFKTAGTFSVEPSELEAARRTFTARRCSDEDTLATIARVYKETGYILDPHTAVGVHALDNARLTTDAPRVALACAHPAKFPDVVERAIGVRPALPEHLSDLLTRQERYTIMPNDFAALRSHLMGV
ncbi:MAG: threonine synthase [Pseudobdellovibrionaceae bacterium]